MKITTDGVATWVMSKNMPKIGKRRATLIAEAFDVATQQFNLKKLPEYLRWNKLWTVEAVDKRGVEEMCLLSIGVSKTLIGKILSKYSIDEILKNPYLLCSMHGMGFVSVDKVAKKVGITGASKERVQSAARYVLEQQEKTTGSTCMPIEAFAYEILQLVELPGKKEIEAPIVEMAKRKEIISDLGMVGFLRKHHMELCIAKRFCKNVAEKITVPKDTELEGNKLTKQQEEALHLFCNAQNIVITGSAGSGKTFLIKYIHHVSAQHGLKVALLAPTGRAAKRISESSGIEAMTIHRALEFNGFLWGKSKTNKMDADVIIIDESSMIDSILAYRLCDAAIDTARMIWIGDVNQLQPVGAGGPFAYMIKKQRQSCNLGSSIRQSGLLKNNANRLLSKGIVGKSDNEAGLKWTLINVASHREASDVVVDLFFKNDKESCQILSCVKDGPGGVNEINVAVQKKIGAMRGVAIRGDCRVFVGDKVMQIKNDYNNWVMNGEIGVVKSVNNNIALVQFDGIKEPIPRKPLTDVIPAYAITVHKSQGSEYDHVVFIGGKKSRYMLHRNMIYTAITRAKKSVTIVSAIKNIETGARTVITPRRKTFFDVFGIRDEQQNKKNY